MKKLFLFSLFALCASAALAADTAALTFYQQALSDFPVKITKQNSDYALSLADGLETWTFQHPGDKNVQAALLLQTRLYLRSQFNEKALVPLFKLRFLFPQTSAVTLTRLLNLSIENMPEAQRKLATRLFTPNPTVKEPENLPLEEKEAKALYALSKLEGKTFYPAATAAFESFFRRYPAYKGNNEVELWYGDLHRSNGNYRAAISQYKKAGELYPDSPYQAASLRLIGDIYADNLKDTPAATAAYTRVLNEYPESAERGVVYKHMAILDENNKQYDSALINYDEAIKLLGTSQAAYEAYGGKADVYMKTKNYEDAYNQWHRTADAFKADKQKTLHALTQAAAIAKKRLRDNARYIQSLEKASLLVDSADEKPQLMFDLASAYEQTGAAEKAKALYKKIIVEYPTDKLASKAQGRLSKLER